MVILQLTSLYSYQVSTIKVVFLQRIFTRLIEFMFIKTLIYKRSIPVRKVLGDLKEKSPLGMMQGC
ncbi:MAG: hypothetical protein K6T72_17370, partial [Anoxybacillus sp.]